MSKKAYTPNEQRSIVKNPNNPAFASDQRNQAQQRGASGESPATTKSPSGDKKG